MAEFKIMDHLKHLCLNKDDECPICMESVFTQTVALLHSKDKESYIHCLCKSCFDNMVDLDKNLRCPHCRNSDYIPVVLDHEHGTLYLPIQKGVESKSVNPKSIVLSSDAKKELKRATERMVRQEMDERGCVIC